MFNIRLIKTCVEEIISDQSDNNMSTMCSVDIPCPFIELDRKKIVGFLRFSAEISIILNKAES